MTEPSKLASKAISRLNATLNSVKKQSVRALLLATSLSFFPLKLESGYCILLEHYACLIKAYHHTDTKKDISKDNCTIHPWKEDTPVIRMFSFVTVMSF